MSSEIAIKVENLGKCYHIYDVPRDRLKQFILPHIQRLLCMKPRKYHRDFWGLKDVSFEVRRGETVGIVGCNGSGKSTLLQMICGTLSPTSGKVVYNGRIAALLELGSGFNPEFTGRENVYMNASVLGLTKDEVDARFDKIAAFADIGEFIEQPVKAYSSGMYVRLAFSVAIHVEPDILVVDEALAVGDIRFQLKCQRKFEELRSDGVTILLVSHSGADVVRLCTQAIWLDKGRVRQIGEPKKVVEEYSAWMLHDTSVVTSQSHGSDVENEADHIEDRLVPVHASAFITGDNGAEVVAVGIFSETGKLLTVIGNAQRIKVVVKLLTKTRVDQPYFAFQVVNEKGLRVMGSNNHVLGVFYEPIEAGNVVVASFSFNFPEIQNGNYLLAVGVADGTPELHVRHQYVADAYEFRVLSTSLMQKQDVLLKIPDCELSVETRGN